MWRLTRAVPLNRLRQATVAKTSARRAQSSLASLDEEFPGLPALTPAAASPVKVETTTLSSGVKVVSTAAGKMASVGLSVAAGSMYEAAPCEAGTALLLKQLAFKGTVKRSPLRLMRDLESVGAVPSASVGREALLYQVKALPEFAEQALQAAFETALTPKITPYLVSDLQAAAAADMEAYATDARLQLSEALYEAAYGENTPLGHPLYSPATGVTSGSLAAYRAKTFGARSITVVGAGVGHAQLLSWAAGLTEGLAAGSAKAAPTSAYVGGEARLKASSDATFVGLALAAPSKADAGALGVLAAAWQAALPAGASVFTLPGLVGVTGAASPSAAGAYVDALLQVLKSTGKDFAAAKKAAQVAALCKLDGALFEGLADGSATVAVDGVSESDVKALHAKIWKGGLSIASLGDVSKVPKLASLK